MEEEREIEIWGCFTPFRRCHMEGTFDIAINFVLQREGGYVNDPDDPGGETNYGISKKSFPNIDIKNLTVNEAKSIYREHYWDACGCDDIPSPLDVVMFDTAVNMGVGTAKKLSAISKSVDGYLFNRIQEYCERVKKNWV